MAALTWSQLQWCYRGLVWQSDVRAGIMHFMNWAVCGADGKGPSILLQSAWFIFSTAFCVLYVLLTFCHLKCAGNVKLVVSAKLEIGNTFTKTAFQKVLYINKGVNTAFPYAGYWKACITAALLLFHGGEKKNDLFYLNPSVMFLTCNALHWLYLNEND